MQFRFFVIPISNNTGATAELNSFLAGHKVLSFNESFVVEGKNSFWAISVSYLAKDITTFSAKKPAIDYKEVLEPEEFLIFAELRDLRKQIALGQGVPPYIIFSNAQLAEMVRGKVSSKNAMLKISGIGKTKVDSYAESFLAILKQAFNNDKR